MIEGGVFGLKGKQNRIAEWLESDTDLDDCVFNFCMNRCD